MLRIMCEVPGVVGMKQSAGDLKSVSDLVASVAPGNVVFTGTDALFYPAFALDLHRRLAVLWDAMSPTTCRPE
jgi:4-hydroxy-tetrahydrodipicolinate synthase